MGLLRCYTNYNVKSSLIWGRAGILFVLGLLVQSSVCLLPLGNPCGDLECKALEYCRELDHTCQPCKDICDSEHHNYDLKRCESDCQNLIHDERYLRLQNSTLLELQHTELEAKYKDLEKDVLILKILVAVCIAVIAVVVACLTAFLVYFWKLMHPQQGDNLEKKKAAAAANKPAELPIVYNNRYGVTTPTPETSPSSVTTYNNNSSVSVSPADTNITTVTSSSTHYPPPQMRASPTKSESSIATPNTMSTTVSTLKNGQSYGEMIGNGGSRGSISNTNRFRREPSESTLPDNCAYDNLSMSPQHYSHHV
ncbi:unnamed protein product [Orchesella dallaii]|uniref:Protein grindelwald n=1 Tax=Orchesella dallaii TaxID=48710 RepID=A0ABP1QKJ8_9HEXA